MKFSKCMKSKKGIPKNEELLRLDKVVSHFKQYFDENSLRFMKNPELNETKFEILNC